VARRVRAVPIGAEADNAEARWDALKKWSRRLHVACDPALEEDGEFCLSRIEIWGMVRHLDQGDLPGADRVERLEEWLAGVRWPFPPGEQNQFGFRTFLDHANRRCAESKPTKGAPDEASTHHRH
jgi:hypothetical protein